MIDENLVVTKPFLKDVGEKVYKKAFRPCTSDTDIVGQYIKITTSLDNSIGEQKLILNLIGATENNDVINSNIIINRDNTYSINGKINNLGSSEIYGAYIPQETEFIIIYLYINEIQYVSCDIISILNNQGKNKVELVEILEQLDIEIGEDDANKTIGSIGEIEGDDGDVSSSATEPTEFYTVKYDSFFGRKRTRYSSGSNPDIDEVYSSHEADVLKNLPTKIEGEVEGSSSYADGTLSLNLEIPAFHQSGDWNINGEENQIENTDYYRLGSFTVSKEGLIVDYDSDASIPLATNTAIGGIKVGYERNGNNLPVQLSNEKAFVDASPIIDQKYRWNQAEVKQNLAKDWYNSEGFIFQYIGSDFEWNNVLFKNGYFYQSTKYLTGLQLSQNSTGWFISNDSALRITQFVKNKQWSNGQAINLNTDNKLIIYKKSYNSDTKEATWVLKSGVVEGRELIISNADLQSMKIFCDQDVSGTVTPLTFTLINSEYSWTRKNVQPIGDGFEFMTTDDVDDIMFPTESITLSCKVNGNPVETENEILEGDQVVFSATILPEEGVQKVNWTIDVDVPIETTNTTCTLIAPSASFTVTATSYNGEIMESFKLLVV